MIQSLSQGAGVGLGLITRLNAVLGTVALTYGIRGELSGHERASTAKGWRRFAAYVFRSAAHAMYRSPADLRTVVESLGNLTKTPSLDPMAHKMAQSIKSTVDTEAIDS